MGYTSAFIVTHEVSGRKRRCLHPEGGSCWLQGEGTLSLRSIFTMRYYVNKNPQPTGEHEVHAEGCDYLPRSENRIYLGNFVDCADAVRAAREIYRNVDGCYYCIRDCHTR